MQFSSVDLKFHEPCVNIYACFPSPYVLQWVKFTSIIFPSPLLSHFLSSPLPIYKYEIDIPEREIVKLTSANGISFSSLPPTPVAIIIQFKSVQFNAIQSCLKAYSKCKTHVSEIFKKLVIQVKSCVSFPSTLGPWPLQKSPYC